jgi:septum formation protein
VLCLALLFAAVEKMKIYLASQSPRRAELLKLMGVTFDVLKIDIAEHVKPDENPRDYSKRITFEKLNFAANYVHQQHMSIHPILCADTEVIHHEKIYGKPRDYQDAFEMLKSYSNQRHLVLTSVGLKHHDICEIISHETYVYFATLDDEAIKRYLSNNTYLDKAGAYGIQSFIGQYIQKIDGCFYSVMGLPLNTVRVLLDKHVYKTRI